MLHDVKVTYLDGTVEVTPGLSWDMAQEVARTEEAMSDVASVLIHSQR